VLALRSFECARWPSPYVALEHRRKHDHEHAGESNDGHPSGLPQRNPGIIHCALVASVTGCADPGRPGYNVEGTAPGERAADPNGSRSCSTGASSGASSSAASSSSSSGTPGDPGSTTGATCTKKGDEVVRDDEAVGAHPV